MNLKIKNANSLKKFCMQTTKGSILVVNLEFSNYFGIILETTALYTPEQKERAKRDLRMIMEVGRTMLHNAKLRYIFGQKQSTVPCIC